MYLIAKGECECYVRDELKRQQFVKIISTGQHFGEIALLTGCKRTATIQTKNYSTIGELKTASFKELCRIYPDTKARLRSNLANYQDHYKIWQKLQLKNVIYFQDLQNDTTEFLNYKIEQVEYEEGAIIFKNGRELERLYIL